jgi:hypothetical protein
VVANINLPRILRFGAGASQSLVAALAVSHSPMHRSR